MRVNVNLSEMEKDNQSNDGLEIPSQRKLKSQRFNQNILGKAVKQVQTRIRPIGFNKERGDSYYE